MYARKALVKGLLLTPFPWLDTAADESKQGVRSWLLDRFNLVQPGPITAAQFALQMIELVKDLAPGAPDPLSRFRAHDFGTIERITTVRGFGMNRAQVRRNCGHRLA